MNNTTAFCEGFDSWLLDDERGGLTDNPYTEGTQAFADWYRGYNHRNDPRDMAFLKLTPTQPIQPEGPSYGTPVTKEEQP